MKRMLSVACLERKKMRSPAQFWAGFEKTPRGDKRKHKITAKSANAVQIAVQLVPGLKKDPPLCFCHSFGPNSKKGYFEIVSLDPREKMTKNDQKRVTF